MKSGDIELVRTVVEDLEYLRTWAGGVDEPTVRRGSGVIRRLVVNDDIMKCAKILGISPKMTIFAPSIEQFLVLPESHKIVSILAGGAKYNGIEIACSMINEGKEPVTIPGVNPCSVPVTFQDFRNATSLYLFGYRYSRDDIIKYVANKLGGVHFDKLRTKDKDKWDNLDKRKDFIIIKGVTEGMNAVYFEMMSIGQLIAKTESINSIISKGRNTT
nr:putative uncharacterized protein [uncultured bacterium]